MISTLKTASNSSIVPKPFLKWAGGKTQLLEQISQFLPQQLVNGKIKKYIEPFMGGGAVFFHIANNYQVQEFCISDINIELVIAYKTIQNYVDELIAMLTDTEKQYLSLDEIQRKEYFYQIRNQFNFHRNDINYQDYNSGWIERTAQMIFLNKTCFNGLFRVNSQGKFNVPVGKYKNPKICDRQNLKAVSLVLQNVEIQHQDFSKWENLIDSQTFIYLDPPYRPLNKTSNFTAYSQQIFNDDEQIRLRDFFKNASNQGAFLMLSNSDPKNEDIEDDFFETAYAGYRIERVKASRLINRDYLNRKTINELLIMNYQSSSII
ncbi:DNA adenine methylase [Okeanomitos corallinicola TIOX110]|uniref:Site-specific DNA-methyltransferase (adenine-specific) n=1 Tax=Okeanomitos corallinicola TIOX110 TaxID=3133117 RepID=A0ABZ2UPG4_9CYAN